MEVDSEKSTGATQQKTVSLMTEDELLGESGVSDFAGTLTPSPDRQPEDTSKTENVKTTRQQQRKSKRQRDRQKQRAERQHSKAVVSDVDSKNPDNSGETDWVKVTRKSPNPKKANKSTIEQQSGGKNTSSEPMKDSAKSATKIDSSAESRKTLPAKDERTKQATGSSSNVSKVADPVKGKVTKPRNSKGVPRADGKPSPQKDKGSKSAKEKPPRRNRKTQSNVNERTRSDKVESSTPKGNSDNSNVVSGEGKQNGQNKRKFDSSGSFQRPPKKYGRWGGSFSEVVKSDTTVIVRCVGGCFTLPLADKLRAEICNRLDATAPGASRPTFESNKLILGALQFICTNSESYEWLKSQITEIDSIGGLKLLLNTPDQERQRQNIVMTVTESKTASADLMFRRIREANNGIDTSQWVLLKDLHVGDRTRTIMVSVDLESHSVITARGSRLYYLLQKIQVKVRSAKLDKERPQGGP